MFCATLGGIYYLSFLVSPENIGDWIPWALVIVAEVIVIFQALMGLWTILAGNHNPKDFHYWNHRAHLIPKRRPDQSGHGTIHSPLWLNGEEVTVDVFVPTFGEPLSIIEETVEAARDLIGKHKTYVLDDGKSDAVRNLAKRLGVDYIRRRTNSRAKAGNINHALQQTKGEYVVIFDADHAPKTTFLCQTLPFFAKPRTAFVQTPQHYTNLVNAISRAAAQIQYFFYQFISTGKNRFNAAFCVGTNVVFRRKALEEIGGMYEKSNSEDIWTSILLHERGYGSVFIPEVLAEGRAPETVSAFTKQQLRWATGGFEILLRHNPLTRPLTFDQKLQYFSSVSFYLLGLSSALLFAIPPIAILLSLTPIDINVSTQDWIFHYAAFYAFYFAIIIYCTRGLRPRTLVLTTALFPVYLKALWNAIRGKTTGWQATGRRHAHNPWDYIVPQVLTFVFLLFTSAVGILNIASLSGILSFALGWNILNTLILGYFVWLAVTVKEGREAERIERAKQQVGNVS